MCQKGPGRHRPRLFIRPVIYRPLCYNFLAMIEQKTVLVLGAGASAPFGFPTGQLLKDLICIETLWRPGSKQLLGKLGFNEDIVIRFRKALEISSRPSVDALLDTIRSAQEAASRPRDAMIASGKTSTTTS